MADGSLIYDDFGQNIRRTKKSFEKAVKEIPTAIFLPNRRK
jgi:hypothetical protein